MRLTAPLPVAFNATSVLSVALSVVEASPKGACKFNDQLMLFRLLAD